MIVFLKDKVFTENNMFSAIIGQHGKSSWDFEITIPVNYDNSFIENCLYSKIIISGVDDSSKTAPKQDFIITKIEQISDDTQNVYIVSGIGEAEYLLQSSIAQYELSYDSAHGETGPNFVNRVLRTFTGKVWLMPMLGGGCAMNFPKIEKGQYLSDWFWSNFKKEKAVCTLKTLSEPGYYALEIIGAEGVDDKIINRFISKKRTWEKSFDMFFAKANNFLFKYMKSPTSSNPMPQVITGTYSRSASIPTNTFNMSSLETALNKIIVLEDASGRDLGLKVQGVVADLDFQWSQYFPIFIQTKTLTHTPGVRMRLKQDSEELINLLLGLHLRTRPANSGNAFPDLGTGVKVDNAVWFSEWKSSDASGPVVSRNAKVYGILVSDAIGELRRYQSGEWTPSSFALTLYEPIADLAAVGTMEFPELPDGHPHSDYEIYQDEFKRVNVGDRIVILGGDIAILTDKVISNENGEVHYDCTTKDLLEIEAKQ